MLTDAAQSAEATAAVAARSIVVNERVNTTVLCRVRGAHPPLSSSRISWFLYARARGRDDDAAHEPMPLVPRNSSGPFVQLENTDTETDVVDYSGKCLCTSSTTACSNDIRYVFE